MRPWSVAKKVHIAIPPPKPTGVYANDKVINHKIESVTVVWQAVSGASRYQIRNAGGAVIYDDTATSVQVEAGNYPLDPWEYAVRACNPYACSAWVNASPRDVPPPAAVPSLSVPSVDVNGSYTVSWGSVSGATSYTLQEQANGGSWHAAYSGSGHSKAYSGKSDGTYGYRVRGGNGAYCGSWSATHAVTVAHPPSTAPSLSLSVSGPSYKPVARATWSSEARATEYVVELSPAINGSTQFYDGPGTTASSLILADGQIGFHVKACNVGGCSGCTEGVRFTYCYALQHMRAAGALLHWNDDRKGRSTLRGYEACISDGNARNALNSPWCRWCRPRVRNQRRRSSLCDRFSGFGNGRPLPDERWLFADAALGCGA